VGQDFIEGVGTAWGEMGGLLQLWAPTVAEDARMQDWWNRSLMSGASPGAAVAWLRMTAQMDVRAALPSISVPTLVVHRRDDRIIPSENSTYLAEHIEGARHVELPGEDHLWWVGDADALLDEIEEFVTGSRGAYDSDQVLTTVMFTDIVASTEHAARLGDRRWQELVSDHDRVTKARVADYRGRMIRTTGDGAFAAFDGPARAIRCALSVVEAAHRLSLDIRAGVHTGECQLAGDDLAGVTVHIGARIADLAQPNQVVVSGTVRDLVVGSNLAFDYIGSEALQGVPGEWRLFLVAGGAATPT
jgi:class 3 adenylate cyclase